MINKVAFLHDRLQLGGGERVSYDTAKLFAKQGVQSYFFAMGMNEKEWEKPTADCQVCLFSSETFKGGAELNQMIDFVKQEQIDRLFIISPIPNLTRRLREETQCKPIFWLHSAPFWQLTHKRERKLAKLRSYPLKAFLPLARLYWHFYFKSYDKKIKALYEENFKYSSAYLVLCPEYKDELIKRLKLNEAEARKIYPVVNTIVVEATPQLEKKKEIIFLGRLSYVDKRVDRLLKIWQMIYQELPDWSIRIYGSGPEAKRLEKEVEELKLERITLEGFVNEPSKVLQSASILCMTSTYEGVPMAMVEAQNQGVVPMAFSVTSGIEYVCKGEAGISIAPFDLDAYAEALKKLCLDDELRQSFQKNCLLKRLDYTPSTNEQVWAELLCEHF